MGRVLPEEIWGSLLGHPTPALPHHRPATIHRCGVPWRGSVKQSQGAVICFFEVSEFLFGHLPASACLPACLSVSLPAQEPGDMYNISRSRVWDTADMCLMFASACKCSKKPVSYVCRASKEVAFGTFVCFSQPNLNGFSV